MNLPRWRRRAAAAIAAAIALSSGVLLTPTSASATACNTGNHCRGEGIWPVHTVYGIYESLNVNCLYAPDWATDFVTAEMWLNTNNVPGKYWVETGMADGKPEADPYQYMYWAQQNTTGYHEYDNGTARLNTAYSDEISWAGNNSWDVYDNGLVGTSTSNPGPSTREDWGSETTDSSSSIRVYATHSSLQYEDTHSTWHSGIGVGGTGNPSYVNNGYLYSLFAPSTLPYTTLYSYDTTGSCGSSSAQPQASTAVADTPVTSQTAAAAIAEGLAAASNVPNPSNVEVAQAPREEAVSVVDPGDTVTTNESSYVVQMSGDFIGNDAKIPAGASVPQGTNMTVVIDAATGRISAWSIDRSPHDLSALGAVTPVSAS